MNTEARRAQINILYQGVNITEDINKDLLSFEYVDNSSKESDSISLSLKDEKHIWLKDWLPEKGDVIIPTINILNWNRFNDNRSLPCGSFIVDEPEYSGRPSVFTINAIASPLNGNFKDISKSKSWNNITLKADSTFLSDLCEEEGLAMKVTDSKIVIFNEKDFEARAPIALYKEFQDSVISYSFKSRLANTNYSGVNVKYYDAKIGKLVEYLYTIGEINEKSKIYQLNTQVKDVSEAMRVAKQTALRLNKKETTTSLTVVGNIEILGGVTVILEEFGAFSGKYYIEKATHTIDNGYVTSFEARKVI